MRRQGQLRRACLPAYRTQQAFDLAIQRLQITLPAACGAHRAGFQRRWVIMYWLFEQGAHESDIGELFNRNRTTVLHGVNQVRQALKSSEAWWWQAVLDKLNERSKASGAGVAQSVRASRHGAAAGSERCSSRVAEVAGSKPVVGPGFKESWHGPLEPREERA